MIFHKLDNGLNTLFQRVIKHYMTRIFNSLYSKVLECFDLQLYLVGIDKRIFIPWIMRCGRPAFPAAKRAVLSWVRVTTSNVDFGSARHAAPIQDDNIPVGTEGDADMALANWMRVLSARATSAMNHIKHWSWIKEMTRNRRVCTVRSEETGEDTMEEGRGYFHAIQVNQRSTWTRQ